MALQFRAVENAGQATASSRVVNKPAGTLQGDKMLFHVLISASGAPAPTMPAGWTLVTNGEITGTASIRIYEKTAGASEAADYTVDFGGSETSILGIISWYSDAAKNIAVDISGNQSNSTTMSHVWPSVTTTVANTVLNCFGSLTVATALAPDAAMIERWDTGTSRRFYLMTEAIASAGATGTRTATSGSNEDSKCVSIALKELDPPPAPSGLNATAVSQSQIDLTWTDNSSNETSFKIERSPDGVGSWAQIDTNATDDNTYSNTGLSAETTYYYRVRASNADGDSAYSNTDDATTLPAPADYVTLAGALAELEYENPSVNATLLGALVELGVDTVNVTLVGALVEFEVVTAQMATYFQNPNPSGSVTHTILPEPVTGYQLDMGGSFWSIVLPQAGENLIKNPSFETNTTGYTVANFASNVRSSEQASKGFYSLRCVPDGATQGTVTYQYFYAIQTGWHVWNLDLYANVNQTFTLEIRDGGGGTLYASATIRPQQNGWARYSLRYLEPTAGNNARQLILKSAAANSGSHPIYTDGWIIGRTDDESVYFDGDYQEEAFDPDAYAFAWTGIAHGSISLSANHVHSSGRIVSFFNLGFLTTAIVGLGMFDPELDIATLTDGDELLKGSLVHGKDFSIIGRIYAPSYSLLATKRQELIDYLNVLNSESGLITLLYQPVEKSGLPYGKRLWMTCAFMGGMSGNVNNLYTDTLELRFRLLSARLYEEFGNVSTVSHTGVGAATTFIYSRDANTGEWEDYLVGSNATTGGGVNCAVILDDGSMVVGGTFTAIGGVSARRCAKWDPISQTWAEYGGGFNSTVFALAIGRGDLNGQVIAVGGFTTSGDTLTVLRRIAYHNGIAFTELATGMNNTIYDVDVSPNGWVYVVGPFLATGGGSTMRTFAGYDASVGGDDLWHNFVTSISGTNTWAVRVTRDNTKIYIGGDFTDINGNTALRCVAQWNIGVGGAGTYTALETGLFAQVVDLEFGPDNYLYAVGDFQQDGAATRLVRRFARWNGVTWEEVGRGEINVIFYFIAFDKRGNAYLSGVQSSPFGTATVLYQWNGSNWIPLDIVANNAGFASTGRLLVSPAGRLIVPLLASTTNIGFAGHTAVTYEGTADARVKLSITGSGVLQRISNWTTNKHIYFNSLTLLDGETLYLDLTGTTPRAWTTYRPDAIDSIIIGSSDLDDFRLVPGVNHLDVFISGTTTANTTALVSWNNHHWSIDAAI